MVVDNSLIKQSFILLFLLCATVSVAQPPIAYYPFNGNANDASGNGNTASNSGAVLTPDRFGNADAAYIFSSDQIIADDPAPFNFSNQDFTLSAWFYGSSDASDSRIISYSNNSNEFYYIDVNNGIVTGAVQGQVMSTTSAVSGNRWHHAALVRSNTGDELSFYVDGILIGSTSGVAGNFLGGAANREFAIGGTQVTTANFNGEIDDIRVYDRALSESEIIDLYAESNWLQESPSSFITNWETTAPGETIILPLVNENTYDFIIDWGDGTVERNTSTNLTHTYTSAGTHTVAITGTFPYLSFNASGKTSSKDKLMSIEQWGDIEWASFSNVFFNCTNLVVNATDAPDLSNLTTTDMTFTFGNTAIVDGVGHWEMSTVTSTEFMFYQAPNFDEDLGGWDISNITSMSDMLVDVGMTTANYDATLSGWATLDAGESQIPSGVTLTATDLTYCTSEADRQSLIDGPNNWTINDAGKDCLENGLIAHYPFNGNANDESGNGNDGTNNGATLTTDRFGNGSTAYSFDGISSYIEVPNAGAFNNINSVTLSTWIKTSTSTIQRYILAKSASFDLQYGIDYGSFGDGIVSTVAWQSAGADHYVASSPNALNDEKWHHIVSAITNGAGAEIYVDGVLVATDNTANGSWDQSGTGPLTIGSRFLISADGFFEGAIDDIRIYNRALSQSEITALYTEGGWPLVTTPTLSTVHPHAATPGEQVQLYGKHFDGSGLAVTIGGSTATVDSVKHNIIYAKVPNTAYGLVDMTVTNDAGSTAPIDFTVIRANHGGYFSGEIQVAATAIQPLHVYAYDVDQDGDMDVLTASASDAKIAWHENDGSQNFTERIISTNANFALSVFAIDIDGDTDIDVLSASGSDDKIAWYENDGSQGFTERIITTNADNAQFVHAADIDGDGDIDVLSASANDNKIAWYENDGSQGFTERVISTNATGAISAIARDVDGDGDMDILSASAGDDKIAWYENDGSQGFTERVISTNATGARIVHADDIDGDGDLDVLSASGTANKIAWYENDGSQGFTERVISTNANTARYVHSADMDGDGDIDVLSASLNDNKVAWYENDGSQGFTEQVISTSAGGARSVYPADVDGEGDMDVLTTAASGNRVYWYQNSAGELAYYPFNGNANDESGNGNDGTNSGATFTTDRFGTANAAAFFDGSSSIQVPSMGNNLSFTTSFWYKTTSGGHIIASDDGFSMFADPVGDRFGTNWVNSNGLYDVGGAPVYFDETWHHVVASHNGDTETIVVYYDGEVFHNRPNSGTFSGNLTDFFFGITRGTSQAPGLGNFTGVADDIGLYSRALTQEEVVALYTEGGWPFITTITSFSPASGPVGSSVAITGTNFDPTPANNIVYFGGAKATVTAASETELTVTVPVGAAHDYISVLTNDLIAYSPLKFSPSMAATFTLDANSFGPAVNITGVNGPRNLVFADIDLDGKLDMAAISQSSTEISLFRNVASSGNLDATSFESGVTFSTGGNPVYLNVADLDRDGRLDLVTNQGTGSIGLFRNNAGSGSFGPSTLATRADIALNAASEDLSIGDLNRDGKLDIATTSNVGTLFQVFNNTTTVGALTSGSFAAPENLTSGAFGLSIAVGDLDGDGLFDVVTGNRDDLTVTSMLNETTGSTFSFGAPEAKSTGNNPWGLDLADIDGDGRLDVVASSQLDNQLYLYRNTSTVGNINLENPVSFALPSGPFQLAIGDLSGDGKPEIVVASTGGGISVFQNQAISGTINSSSLAARIDYPSNNGELLAIGDLDGDGANDIAVAAGGTISLLRNTLLDGPIAQYDFTSGSTADVSGYGFNPTVNGSPQQVQDRFLIANQAYSFDGTSDFMNASDFDLEPEALTLVSWFTLADGADAGPYQILDVEGVAALAASNDAVIGVIKVDGSFNPSIHNTEITPKDWYMLALTYDGANSRLYLNGVLVETLAAAGNIDYDGLENTIIIGTNFDGPLSFNGELDDLKIYGRALDATEVRELYNDRGWDVTNINEFSLASQVQEATIDTAANTVDIVVVFGTDLTTTPLTPTFTLSTGATARVAGAVQTSGATANNYANPVTYEITSEDGLTVENWTVTVTVDNGIVVDLPFSGDALDQSGKGNDGTLNGGVTLTEDRFSNPGSAYLFDGIDDFIDVSGATSAEFSASFWFKANTVTSANNSPDLQSIYYLYNTEGGTTAHSTTRLKANKIDVVQLRQQSPNAFESYSQAFNDNVRWHHMVVTGSATQPTTIYIDNQLKYTGSMGFTGWTDLVLGYSRFNGGTDYFDGAIDDVKVFSYVIDEVKVDELYRENGWPLQSDETDIISFSVPGQNGDALIDTDAHRVDIEVQFGTDPSNLIATFELSPGATATVNTIGQTSEVNANDFTNPLIYRVLAEDEFTVQSWLVTITVLPDMVAYYPFNGNTNDASGNGNHGSIAGGVSPIADRFGNTNRAYSFNGVDGLIDLPFNADQLSNTFSINAWYYSTKATLGGQDQGIVSNDLATDEGISINVSSNLKGTFVNDADTYYETSSALIQNEWHMVTLVFDGTRLELWENGASVDVLTPVVGPVKGLQNFQIGHDQYDAEGFRYFGGSLDDIRFYGRALTAQEITDLYTEGGWPLTPDAGESVLARQGSGGIEADGTSFETLTVQLKDATGRDIPTAGVAVQFAAAEGTTDDDSDEFIDPSGLVANTSGSMTVLTDGSGLATVRLTNSEVEQLAVTARIDTDGDDLVDAIASGGVTPVLIDYVIGAPSVAATGSVISSSGPSAVADGASAITVTVQVRDVSGRAINQAGIEVQFVTSGSALLSGTAGSTVVQTNGQGMASVEVSNTVIEAVSVRALIDVNSINGFESPAEQITSGGSNGTIPISFTADPTAALISNAELVSVNKAQGIDITLEANKTGTIYWVINTTGVIPTAENIKSGNAASNGNGSFNITTPDVAVQQAISGSALADSTRYQLYLVHEDANSNFSAIEIISWTADATPPQLATAAINPNTPTTLTLVFTEELVFDVVAGITLRDDADNIIPFSSGATGPSLNFGLTLNQPITGSDSLHISYDGASGNFTDVATNALASFTTQIALNAESDTDLSLTLSLEQVNQASGITITHQSNAAGKLKWLILDTSTPPIVAAFDSQNTGGFGIDSITVTSTSAVTSVIQGTGLAHGTTYYLYAIARNTSGQSSDIQSVSWTADGVAPEVTNAIVSNDSPNRVRLTISEDVSVNGVSGFSIASQQGAAITITGFIENSPTSLDLLLNRPIAESEVLSLSYTPTGNEIADAALNDLASTTGFAIINDVVTIPPVLSNVAITSVNGVESVTISYQVDKAGIIYWLVAPTGGTFTAAQIKAGTGNNAGFSSFKIGDPDILLSQTIAPLILANNEVFDLHLFAEDEAGVPSTIEVRSWEADGKAPTLISAEVLNATPTQITVVFDEALVFDDLDGFSFEFLGTRLSVTTVEALDDVTLVFNLNGSLAQSDRVLLSYSPTVGNLRDNVGNSVRIIEDFEVDINILDPPASLSNLEIVGINELEAIDLQYQSSKTGRMYWVMTNSAAIPNEIQLKTGGTSNFGNGVFDIAVANQIAVETLPAEGLQYLTAYYVHLVQEDDEGNLSNVSSLPWITPKGPPTIDPLAVLNVEPLQIDLQYTSTNEESLVIHYAIYNQEQPNITTAAILNGLPSDDGEVIQFASFEARLNGEHIEQIVFVNELSALDHYIYAFGTNEKGIDSEIAVASWLPLRESGTDPLIRNLITPNGDGQNDRLFIENLELYPGQHTVTITDRNGKPELTIPNFSNDNISTTSDFERLEPGAYICVLILADGTKFMESITILKQ